MATSSSSAVQKRQTLTERYEKLRETVELVENDRQILSEALSNAVSMLRQEDVGWAQPGVGEGYKGLSLTDLKGWSNQIRASLTGTAKNAPNPHMRNGIMLRHSFIWDGGIHYDKIPGDPAEEDDTASGTTTSRGKSTKPRQGRANVRSRIDDPQNQRLVFGSSARRKREHALYSDGMYIVVGDSKTKRLRPIPLSEITDMQADELYEDEIVAYRWTRMEAVREPGKVGRGGKTIPGRLTQAREEKSYWVYVDWYEGEKPDYVNYNGNTEEVLTDHVIFDLHANRPDGAPLGSPDAISALVWARVIRDLIMNGVKMQDALAMFAFKATSPTKAGQQATALELAEPTKSGSAAVIGGGSNFDALSTAGKGYDFGSIGFVVSTMAASLHVSGISLSANTALAGSSYGAAKTLDLPGRMAMETRRAEHVEFDKRILKWLGAPNAMVYFDTYEDATDEYRAVQAAMLAWTTGTLSPKGFRDELEIIYGRKLSGEIPDGVMIPNNVASAARTDIDPNGASYVPTSAAAPGQGKSDGTGGADHLDDKPQSGK